MNKNDQEFLIQKIRTQYVEKENTELDTLKALDNKVKRPVNVFSYIFGTLSVVIMGCGMSFVMTDIGELIGVSSSMTVGIVVGVIGMVMAIVNYPVYKGILNSRKKKYANEIVALSNKLMNK